MIYSHLNKGKIVVFNVCGYDGHDVAFVIDSFLPRFIKRSKEENPKPVSLFLDEAVKILSNKSDFGEEILRQSKVELIMLFQNESKLKDKIGSNKYEALIGNLTNIYLMKNKDNFTIGKDEIDCSVLNQFECMHDNTTCLLNPIFIN